MVEAEETKLDNLEEGMKIVDMATFSIGNQVMQKAKLIASTKVKAGRWSALVAKAQRDKETTEQKWVALKTQLDFL